MLVDEGVAFLIQVTCGEQRKRQEQTVKSDYPVLHPTCAPGPFAFKVASVRIKVSTHNARQEHQGKQDGNNTE